MKPRRPKVGTVSKRMEKVEMLSRQVARERQRHANKRMSMAVQRDALRGVTDFSVRAAMLAKLTYEETEEHQRHAARVADLERRLRDARR